MLIVRLCPGNLIELEPEWGVAQQNTISNDRTLMSAKCRPAQSCEQTENKSASCVAKWPLFPKWLHGQQRDTCPQKASHMKVGCSMNALVRVVSLVSNPWRKKCKVPRKLSQKGWSSEKNCLWDFKRNWSHRLLRQTSTLTVHLNVLRVWCTTSKVIEHLCEGHLLTSIKNRREMLPVLRVFNIASYPMLDIPI